MADMDFGVTPQLQLPKVTSASRGCPSLRVVALLTALHQSVSLRDTVPKSVLQVPACTSA